MANQNVFTHLTNKGKVSILKGWNLPTHANIAALPTDIPAVTADGNPTYQLALLEDTGSQVFWKGLPLLPNPLTTTANGGWYAADKDQEVILNVVDPPVDTWDNDTLVPDVAPTVTGNTKLITWTAPSGDVHLYQVERNGSGVVTGFTEITANKLGTIEDNTLNTAADVLALSPLRKSTYYKNPDSGALFMVDQYGTVHTLEDGEFHVTVVTNTLSLVAGVETVVDINWVEGATATELLSRNPDILDGETIETVNDYSMVIVARDPSNNSILSITGWNIRQIDEFTFGATSNIDTDVRLTAQFPAKVSAAVVPVTYNFDVETVDWSGAAGVTDQTTFEAWVLANSDYTSITVTDFIYSTTRIQCNVSASGGSELYFSSFDITNVNAIGGFSGLVSIELNNNQIVNFNPTIALPSSLINLELYGNLIINFNPSIALPSNLQTLFLISNQMTTAGYTATETWANAQPSFSSNCDVYFTSNLNSVTGTNLETILTSKNCTVRP